MATYAISDIHGNWQKYKKFKTSLDVFDSVYVLGDVIDRGKDGIDILIDMMKDERFIILMGNHEHMMYSYLKAIKKMNHEEGHYWERVWLSSNGGQATYDAYLDLTDLLKKDIGQLLERMPIAIPDLNINGRHFCLVHSSVPGWDFNLKKPIYIKDTGYRTRDIEPYLWERVNLHDFISPFDDGRIIVAGHTPVLAYGDESWILHDGKSIADSAYIDIDGGLAYGEEGSLIALRLDDLEAFYF